jgi:prevent-host-death family protein
MSGPVLARQRSDTGVVRVGMHEAKSQLSRLVKVAAAGEDVLIQRSGHPVARLVAVERHRAVADAFGSLRGEIEIADDFDELPSVHADPFDRLLAARGVCEHATIVSADPIFDEYGLPRIW